MLELTFALVPVMTDPDALDAALLAYVLQRHPAAVHHEELARAFAPDDWSASATALVTDGLMHREGQLHVVSRAVVRAAELLG